MRKCELARETKETLIELNLNLDGGGINKIDTGIGFFDHMLELFAVHGNFDLTVACKGDTRVDGHHTVEDTGIVLGKALFQALGDKKGIKRFASLDLPMDESLASIALDISGRSCLVFNAKLKGTLGSGFDMELIEEFFKAFVNNAGITLHINLLYGSNNHHNAEAIFKGVAQAIKKAIKIVGSKIPSSKGII